MRNDHLVKENVRKTPVTVIKTPAKRGSSTNGVKQGETANVRKTVRSSDYYKRPNTCSRSAVNQKKSDGEDYNGGVRARSASPTQAKTKNVEQGTAGATLSASCTSPLTIFIKEKNWAPKSNRGEKPIIRKWIKLPESMELLPLLAVAVVEQEKITEMLKMERENLHKRMEQFKPLQDDESSSDYTIKGGDWNYFAEKTMEESSLCREKHNYDLREFYHNNLDEVFQAWINLFYFIINLRVNLLRAVNVVGTEKISPKAELEKDLITRAIECVKIFSKLKIKSLMEFLSEFRSRKALDNYEEKVLSPLLMDMDFMTKKAKDMVLYVKRENTRKSIV